ncbi:MAG: nucleoside hydrolase [Pseudomonadota bacterium]
MAPRKVIIDTDPGQDDAVAILFALASPEIELLGLTCVAGNVPLDLTERNARKICELAGRADLPVYAGCDRPMRRGLITAEHVHGETGLKGPDLPMPTMSLAPGHAVDFLIHTLRREPAGSVTLVPIGPLTNIAIAFGKAPDIVSRVAEIILMGGACFPGGNVTPTAEFNFYVDPHAAQIVLSAGVRTTILPLDVTHQALVNERRNAAFRDLGTPVGEAVAALTRSANRLPSDRQGDEGAPLHDPCTIAYLLRPELFSGRHVNVEIETEASLTLGMSVVDWRGVTDKPHNALFLREIDADGFFALLTERLARL